MTLGKSLNLFVGGVCNFLGSVSLQQKFEMVDQCYSSFTAQFYLAGKGKYILKVWGQVGQIKRGAQFWLLFLYVFFLLPLSLSYVNWASQEGCVFRLRFSLPSSDLPLFHFHASPFFVFYPLSFWTPFSYSNYLTYSFIHSHTEFL